MIIPLDKNIEKEYYKIINQGDDLMITLTKEQVKKHYYIIKGEVVSIDDKGFITINYFDVPEEVEFFNRSFTLPVFLLKPQFKNLEVGNIISTAIDQKGSAVCFSVNKEN